ELTWGSHYDKWDLENTKFILNFGSNVLEAHTNHIPMAQRCVDALASGAKMYTFDVRLSNTAVKSTEWILIKAGTDLAVILAMCNVLMENGIYDRKFIETYTNVTVDELKQHLSRYTPEWAEGVSGVPAEKIRSIALEYVRTRPSVCISYRGAVMHYNGVQTERAVLMLEALAGNIDISGGRCRAVGAKWKSTISTPKGPTKKLKILDGEKGDSRSKGSSEGQSSWYGKHETSARRDHDHNLSRSGADRDATHGYVPQPQEDLGTIWVVNVYGMNDSRGGSDSSLDLV
ncbi:hypothetical protein LCGC14_3148080, partial [marine sediment metagenome]